MANPNNLRAFLIYSKKGILAGGPVLRTKAPKERRIFVEIPYELCCSDVVLPALINGGRKLKAFVRYTDSGKVVPNSAIKRVNKPLDGRWIQVPLDNCCFYVTTTTTTTTSTSSTTTTTTTVATTTTTSSTTTTTTTV